RQKTEHQRVDDVVDEQQVRPGDLPQVPVQVEPRARGDRRRDEGPTEDGEQVADEQSQHQVESRHTVRHEQWPDHELRPAEVLAGVQPHETAGPLQPVRRHGFAVELVDGVESIRQRAARGRYGHRRKAAARPPSMLTIWPVVLLKPPPRWVAAAWLVAYANDPAFGTTALTLVVITRLPSSSPCACHTRQASSATRNGPVTLIANASSHSSSATLPCSSGLG